MSLLQDILSYWKQSELLARIDLEDLGSEAHCAGLKMIGSQPVVRAYVGGGQLCRTVYRLSLRCPYLRSMEQASYNAAYSEQLTQWGMGQLPALHEGRKALRHALLKSPEVTAVQNDVCRVDFQWELFYLQGSGSGSFHGHTLAEFGACMTYPQLQSCAPEVSIFQGDGHSSLQLLRNGRTQRELVCQVDFWEVDSKIRAEHMAAFEALFAGNEPVEIDWGDGYSYWAVLTAIGQPKQDAVTSISYTFRAVRHGPWVEERRISDAVIHCPSSFPKTDCILIIPCGDLDIGSHSLTVRLGEQYWGISGPITGNVIMDGIHKTITMGGVSCVNKAAWTDFPYLTPGDNSLIITADGVPFNCHFTIQYYPTYL